MYGSRILSSQEIMRDKLMKEEAKKKKNEFQSKKENEADGMKDNVGMKLNKIQKHYGTKKKNKCGRGVNYFFDREKFQ